MRHIAHSKDWCLAVCLLYLLSVSISAQPQSSPAGEINVRELERTFAKPPDDARIMMRWWWFGPAVDKSELEREMVRMKEGGIGGFEVQPVYPLGLDDPEHNFKNLPYLSDEFLDALRFVSQKAKELGLRMDLTLGSGWPYGGSQVPVNEAAGSLRIVRVKTDEYLRLIPVPNLVDSEQLLAAFSVEPNAVQESQKFQRITGVHGGMVSLPEDLGSQEILFFISSHTGMQVKRAAVGAEGFVLDHYDKKSVADYLHNVGDRLMQAFPDDRPYAIFCDSLEAYASDWTPQFNSEFQKRRGYDLLPHLPELTEENGEKTKALRRDWGKTLTELFDQNFASAVHDWAKLNRTRFRMQGYGIPPAELSSNALADLPEGEGAQWKSLSATRWASSASHIYGVPVTSSETWTWLHSPVFRATPLDMKAEGDRHFLEGINQLVGHGWPYTPPSVAYPGWRFYAAAVFDEKNPWWTVMPDITAYLQRVSYLLRQGEPVNDVAVYLPNDDAWASFRPGHASLFESLQSYIGTGLIEAILASGNNFDFFDEEALQKKGRIDGKTLVLGPNRYRTVILPNVETIAPQTYRKFQEFARSGGVLIATRKLPSAAPGFLATSSETAEVHEISRDLFQSGNSASFFIPDEEKLSRHISEHTDSDVSFSPSVSDIGFVHRRLTDADIYFVANTSNQREVVDASFRVTGAPAESWDPMTGAISGLPVKDRQHNRTTITLDLEPYASRIVVFSQATSKASAANSLSPATGNSTVVDISHDWSVIFGNDGKPETMHDLRSWTDDPETRYFSGQATYENTITVSAGMLRNSSIRLDFGEGKALTEQKLQAGMQAWLDTPIREAAIVYVNGKGAGSVWCPPYSLEIRSLLQQGENLIRIQVANLALNNLAGQALPDYRLLNLRYGVRFEAQNMDKVQPVPAGLIGPIRLIGLSANP